MLRLHYAPDNASLIVRIALEELRLPYEARLVDRSVSAQKSPAYHALNPRGQIPVLETPDGPIFETAAILLWLTETAGALAPPPGDPARGTFLSWMFALSNGMQSDLRRMFYAARYVGEDPAAVAAHRARTVDRLGAALDRLEDLAGAGHGWFCGATPSVLDIYAAVMMRWMALYPAGHTGWFRLARWPALDALAARLETRPAVQRAADLEGLGPTPLTAPRPCPGAT
jgi:glutathione S-transferase